MLILKVLIGAVALTLSRQLYWLFVSAVGVFAGIILTSRFLVGLSDSMVLSFVIISGLAGMLLAFSLQRFAVMLAGAAVSGFLVYTFLGTTQFYTGSFEWLIILLGALLGAAMVWVLFDWTLIVLSSLTGATLITQTVHFNSQTMLILFVALTFLGIAIQTLMWQQEQPATA